MVQKRLAIICLFIIALCFTQSCNQSTITPNKIITENFSFADTTRVLLSDITSGDVKKITLQLPSNINIGEINQVVSNSDILLILDFTPSILLFDLSGRFIKKIGEQGRGPGEYIYPSGITLDKSNNIIYVSDSKKILKYSYSGEFIGEIVCDNYPEYISYFGNKLHIISTVYGEKTENFYRTNVDLLSLNEKGERLDSLRLKHIDTKKLIASSNPKKHFISFNGKQPFFYYPILIKEDNIRDTLYKLENDRIVPFISLRGTDCDKEQTYIKNMYYSGKYVFMEGRRSGENFTILYNTKLDKVINAGLGIFDDKHTKKNIKKLSPLEDNQLYFIEWKTELDNPDIFIFSTN